VLCIISLAGLWKEAVYSTLISFTQTREVGFFTDKGYCSVVAHCGEEKITEWSSKEFFFFFDEEGND